MKIKAQYLANFIEVLQNNFNFNSIEEMIEWLINHPKDEFEIKYK